MLLEADEALVADDEVIDQLDVKHATSRHELFRGLDVLLRRGWVATGVVVAEDDARAVADHGEAEDLGGAQHRAVGGALIEAHLFHQLAFGIQQEQAHLV